MSDPTRRSLLRLGALAAFAVAVPAGGSAYATTVATGPTRLRSNVFRPLVGTEFHLDDGARTYRAVLVSVEDDVHGPRRDGAFSLTFEVRGRARPTDRVHAVSHPRLRTFGLFVTGVGRGNQYEAVVNS